MKNYYNLLTTLINSMYRQTLIVMLWRLSLNLELLQQMSLTLTARFLLDMDSRWWQSWDVSHRKIFHRWYKKIFDISIGQVGLYNYLFWLQSLVTTHFFSIWKKLILTSWAPSTVVNVNNALAVTTISRLQGVVPVRCCKVQSPPPARWLSKDIRR